MDCGYLVQWKFIFSNLFPARENLVSQIISSVNYIGTKRVPNHYNSDDFCVKLTCHFANVL